MTNEAFAQSADAAFSSGHVWAAIFDLTAFYDRFDHNVLRYMPKGLGLDHDHHFCMELIKLLNKWTATTTQIYHDHGIPQGPLSSGLISKAVLKHFDENLRIRFYVRYFRYVDDIQLFAKSKDPLRLRSSLWTDGARMWGCSRNPGRSRSIGSQTSRTSTGTKLMTSALMPRNPLEIQPSLFSSNFAACDARRMGAAARDPGAGHADLVEAHAAAIRRAPAP